MSDFKLANVVDAQLEDITSELTLPVVTGAQSNTFLAFNSQAGVGQTQYPVHYTSAFVANSC